MRVGVVCPYDMAKAGGVQQLTTELSSKLRSMGNEVILVGAGKAAFPGGPGGGDSVVPAGRSISIRANRSKAPVTLVPAAGRRVRSAMSDVDVVHIHEPLVPLVGWAALSVDKPIVATFHADASPKIARFYRIAPWISRRLKNAVLTAVSASAARHIPPRWGEVSIIPNAVDVPAYRIDVGRVARRVAFLGRDDPRKGLDVLLEAWPEVRSAVPGVELVVIGADRSEHIEGVSFRGRVSEGEKRRLLATSSLFVAPNLGGESFGITIAEAMAAGCAVVASDLPAFRDVVGDAAVMVPVAESRALSAAIASLLSHPDEVRRLGEAGMAEVARYDWSVVVDSYLMAYRRAMAL